MRKKGLILLIILLQAHTLSAQDDYAFDGGMLADYQLASNPSVQSPDVTAFQKVTQVPVNNYTGRANISIPIYTIQVGNMTVPISLTYNSSGVKVADMPSNVGSNWALNAGGVVTKMVQGIDDFTVPKRISNITGGNHEYTPAGWLISTSTDYNWSPNQQNDPAPDIYHVSAPGLSTKFTHERSSSLVPIEIENNGNTIENSVDELYAGSIVIQGQTIPKIAHGMEYVNVTALNGVQYNFATPEIVRTFRSDVTLNTILDAVSFKANANKLDRMYDPATNQSIDFEYEEYSNNFHDNFYYRPGVYNYSANVLTNRLTRINFDGGFVEFIYDLDRIDNEGEKALTEVRVTNFLGDVIKRVKLEYDYFQSSINPSSAQSKRLRLDRVYQVDANSLEEVGDYIFTYNTSIDMPPRDSWAHDFLGYNNGSYASSISVGFPNIYRSGSAYDNNHSLQDTYDGPIRTVYRPIPSYSGQSPTIAGNFSLEADAEAVKAYVLTAIQYPTGGSTEFQYESNTFHEVAEGGTKIGGGLRLRSQKTVDEYGIEQILDYEYYIGNLTLPRYDAYVRRQRRFFNVPQSQVELTNNSFVGYRNVFVRNRYTKEQTEYIYYTKEHYPNITSSKTLFGSGISTIVKGRDWRAEGHYSLNIDRDILRGKLRSKHVVNKNGLTVLKQDYEYFLKQFRTIEYTFQNPLNDLSNPSQCFSEKGLYYRYCGGYDEVISFPIERNLLVSVKTKMLEDFHNEIPNEQGQIQEFGDYVETEKRYWYDSEYPRLHTEEQGMELCGREYYENYESQDWAMAESPCENPNTEYISKTYSYPSSGSLLGNQHRLTTPLAAFVKNEKGLLKQESYQYKDFGQDVISLENVDYFTTNNSGTGLRASDVIIERDHKGNILEVVSQEGVYTSFIYGYGSRYMICELNNVSYTELTSAASALGISLTNLTNTNSDTQIKSETNQLRAQLSNGQIKSYTYTPLVGVTSITDVRGRETTYKYDAYNRLEFVKDHDQNIVSKNTYNYKN